MAAPRLRVPNSPAAGRPLARNAQQVSDEVELYHRTYTTLLRSSGETLLRVLEPSHRSMTSSLHSLAGSEELDLGAFLYAIRRLPDAVSDARVIVMGQEVEVFARHGIGPLEDWTPLEAPARRRRWFADGKGTLAVLLASASDLDDLVPTLVAYQLEWNKLHRRLLAAPDLGSDAAACAVALGGDQSDWEQPRGAEERAAGVTHLSSETALRVSAQVMPLDRLRPELFDPRLGDVDAKALAAAPGVIVNIEYPLGLAAYNILREITTASDTLRGVYVLGKAATLNAAVGDVMISSVILDEHSGSTYWLDNAFSVDDIAPYLVFGSGLDNQRAVTVKSTFLQNREYLDLYYREAFTVVEMEAGPFCDAVYEVADVDRHPTGEAVNFAKLPLDLGIIHYASDTPYTQARTLGARGLSYYGMDSTYASTIAIARRVFHQSGVLRPLPAEAAVPEPARP